MRASDYLIEGASDILYHYCSIHSAAQIMQKGQFLLSSATGNKSEEQYAPAGYPYFLSTARNKVADYSRYPLSGAVMFNLDGRWLGSRYPVKPMDYWDRAWMHSPDRTSEQEDRVFSKQPGISLDCVTAIHIFNEEQDEQKSPRARAILLAAKQRGIPTYFYTDETAWKLQDTRKVVPLSQAPLRGSIPTNRPYTPDMSVYGGAPIKQRSRNYALYRNTNALTAWVELLSKSKVSTLTERASKLLFNLKYYASRYSTEDGGLGADMANERKPNSTYYPITVQINDFMRRQGMKSTIDVKNFVIKRWEELGDDTKKVAETVNPNQFFNGFEKKKVFTAKDGHNYILVAKNGYIPYSPTKQGNKSEQFRVEAYIKNSVVGWVNFEMMDDHLEALDLQVDPQHRRKGLATAMYDFAKEIGNDIMPSPKQTTNGKAFTQGRLAKELTEAPRDIKLMLFAMGYDINFIRNQSNKIKQQFIEYNQKIHNISMKTLLSSLNSQLIKVSVLPQWSHWRETSDGIMVYREIENIYTLNIEFLKKYGKYYE